MPGKVSKYAGQYWQLVVLTVLGIYEVIYQLFGVWSGSQWVTFIAFSSVIVLKSIQGQNFNKMLISNVSLSNNLLTKETQIEHLNAEIESHKADLLIINRLVSEGAVGREDIIDSLKETSVYFVYCYAIPFPNVDQSFRINRIYPERLEKLGFDRVDRMGRLFISSEARLTKSLWNPKVLLDFLKSEIDGILKEEWEDFIEKLRNDSKKKRKLVDYYNKYSEMRYDDILKIKVIVTKALASDVLTGDVPRPIDLKKLTNFFNELTNLKRLVKPLNKVKVRTVLESTSITYLVDCLNNYDQKKLIQLEPSIREVFDIEGIFNYKSMYKKDLEEYLSRVFNGSKSSAIAEQIIDGSKMLWEAFNRLQLN